MKTHHGIYLLLAAMIAAYFVVILVALALFWPVKTLEVFDGGQPIPVKTKILHPGDQLEYQLDYCKYRDDESTVHRQLIDGQIITLQDTSGHLQAGCHNVTIKTAIIPETINPGRYYLDVKVDYPINPLRDNFIGPTRTHYRTEYFDVEAPVQKATTVIYGQPTVIYVQPQRIESTGHDSPEGGDTVIINTVEPTPEAAPKDPHESIGTIIHDILPF